MGEGKNEEIDSPENIFSPPFFLWEKNILEGGKFNKLKIYFANSPPPPWGTL